ncbi:RES family NAD+ phosphorylase [bacterium]|nr:RES family NAD+ phosphorylase [bacterium]
MRQELKHVNRFFPESGFGVEEARLLGYLIAEPADIPNELYRARILDQDEPFTASEMGKPPSKIASHGRANPYGISYLYVADEIDTTIAEVRPHKGEKVCIASIHPVRDLKFIDLCSPEKGISPFGLEEEDVRLLAGMIPYLRHLGEELSRPISPNRTHLEYLPTQYLCEFIKRNGYDGVIYKSSVGEGLNYAIFDDSAIRFDEKILTYEVINVDFDSRPLAT